MQEHNKVKLAIEASKADETKMPIVMNMIEKAASIMEEKNCNEDQDAQKELSDLQDKLRNLTDNKNFNIRQIYGYWAYADLETIAAKVLMKKAQKYGFSEETLKGLIQSIFDSGDLEKQEGFNYWDEFLEMETGVTDVMDCLFCENAKGEIEYASIHIVMEKIKRRKKEMAMEGETRL